RWNCPWTPGELRRFWRRNRRRKSWCRSSFSIPSSWWRGACSRTSSTASSSSTATTLPSRCPPRRACSAVCREARVAARSEE
ncbi:unnamed protein product, partial [Ectocarpus sp. 13 AM-2016]